MQIYSFSPFGYEGALVSVEVDLRRGIPAVDIVGLADGAIKESRERMRSAIRNSGFEFPPERVLISLSPADLKKEGAGFDLPIALAVLSKSLGSDGEENHYLNQDSILILGELELNGNVRPVRAVHAATTTAFEMGIKKCIVPSANLEEAKEVKGMKVFGADTLSDAFQALLNDELFTSSLSDQEKSTLPQGAVEVDGIFFPAVDSTMEYGDVKNQERLVRALQIAAAGRHNLMAYGPPGCGKTLALQKFQSLLPLLTVDEAQSVTRIYSIAGLLKQGQSLLRTAPFRQPHQTCSIEGMCGGGVHCIPGEISLAHKGVLFLDEAAEFRSSVLQMLRVPLEGGSITLSRAGRSTTYPANFQLLMATNPCPCGNFGSKTKLCLCSGRSIEQYWKKFSAPLLDRIDFRVHVELGENIPSDSKGISTAELRKGIARAVKVQKERQGKLNSQLTPPEMEKYCSLSNEVHDLLESRSSSYGFSPRSLAGCIKVSRTIADMEGKAQIDSDCMAEAINFRHVEEDFIMM